MFEAVFPCPVVGKSIMQRLISQIPKLLLVSVIIAVEPNANGLLGYSALALDTVETNEMKSNGLKPGDPVGTFRVIKVAGAEDDGVEVGQSLCYRCRYGSSPIVMVFAKQSSKEIDPLISALEKSLTIHEAEKLRAFVIVVGDDLAKLKEKAASVVERTGVKKIPVVVTEDSTSGPLDYQLSAADDITVVIARDSQVFAVEVISIDQVEPNQILTQVEVMLKE
jgi:hypothetical protein